MTKIVAIGGGELKNLETLSIDKEIVRLTEKRRPKALFVPTASGDSEDYWESFRRVYGWKLGCDTDVLFLLKNKLSKNRIKDKINSADLIYVGGGNTLKMFKVWKRYSVDDYFKEAYKKGTVLSGLSAGAICWFKYGCSDSGKSSKFGDVSLMRVTGLGLVDLTVSPHHIKEKHRKEGLVKIMKRTPGVGVALDDYTALEIVDNEYRIIRSKSFAEVHKVYRKGGNLNYEPIGILGNCFSSIDFLIEKS